jgi:uncharacterized damage-inducible protein DinB
VDRSAVAEAIDFLYWMRDRVVAAAGQLTDTEFCCDTPRATRSLRGTLAHQIECEWAWRIRLGSGAFPDGDVVAAEFASVGSLMRRWMVEEQCLRTLLTALDDAALEGPPPGPDNPLAMWRYLLYVVNHGTQQLTEAALLLTQLGHSPGDLGYLAFCADAERGASAA